jgi:hypothetical protein
MDAVLDADPQILDAVHKDLTAGLGTKGRAVVVAERVLRSATLKQDKGYASRRNYFGFNARLRLKTLSLERLASLPKLCGL